MATRVLPEMEEWLQLRVILVAEFYGDNNRTDVATNGYRFVAIFNILDAKETEGKFHAVLSFFEPFLQSLAVNYQGIRDGIPNKIRVRQCPTGFRIAKSVSCKKSQHLSYIGKSVQDVKHVNNYFKKENTIMGKRKVGMARQNRTIRLSKSELQRLADGANAAGMSESEYVRHLIMHGGVDTDYICDRHNIIRQITGVATNINQAAKWANENKNIPQSRIDQMSMQLGVILGLLKELIQLWR